MKKDFGFLARTERSRRIPNYDAGKWLLHDVFFIVALLIGYIPLDQERFLSAGLGIILWELMNTLNHVGCSIQKPGRKGCLTRPIFLV